MAILDEKLIKSHAEYLLERGLDSMMDSARTDDIRRLHTMLTRVGMADLTKNALVDHIRRRGTSYVSGDSSEAHAAMVPKVLAFKDKVDNVLRVCFEDAEDFVYSAKHAFEHFINVRQNKPAELLAKQHKSSIANYLRLQCTKAI